VDRSLILSCVGGRSQIQNGRHSIIINDELQLFRAKIIPFSTNLGVLFTLVKLLIQPFIQPLIHPLPNVVD